MNVQTHHNSSSTGVNIPTFFNLHILEKKL